MLKAFVGKAAPWRPAGLRSVGVAVAALTIAVSCGNPSGAVDGARESGASSTAACPDHGPRLPITGLCAGRAANYLNIAEFERFLPDGCEWVVEETPFATDVLLYRAAKCGDQITKLEFAGGAHMAELTATGGYSHTISVMPAEASDPHAVILRTALPSVEDPAERAACRVRKADYEFWPPDALVVDTFTSAQASLPEEDGPRMACGDYGYNGDEASFWRVFQGYAWFFRMGQEGQMVDTGSLTLMTKGEDGAWTQVE